MQFQGMSGASVRFLAFPANAPAPKTRIPARDLQRLWFALARGAWSSLVLVPGDEGVSTSGLAVALADVGSRLCESPVTAILAEEVDYESARILVDLELRVNDDRLLASGRGEPRRVDGPTVNVLPPAVESGAGPAPGDGGALLPPMAQVVVAIQPVVVEPLGLAIAHAADAVVLCLQAGSSRLARARRTIELVGADRIAGAILVR